MAKTMHCRELGFDCNYVARGQTEEEVMEKAAEHAQQAHNIQVISPHLAQQVQAAIRDE